MSVPFTTYHFQAIHGHIFKFWRVKSQSRGGERTWVKWNTFFTRWKFPPKFPEILCKWKTPGDCWSKHKSGCLQVFVQYANAIHWNALRLRTTRSVHKSHFLSNQSIVCSWVSSSILANFRIYLQFWNTSLKATVTYHWLESYDFFFFYFKNINEKSHFRFWYRNFMSNQSNQSRNFLSKFSPFQFNILENDFN